MDHPMMGAGGFEAARRAAYVPPISVGGPAVGDRLNRHLAALAPEDADQAPPGAGHPPGESARLGAAQTVQLLREITPRPAAHTPQRRRLSLWAPLRSVKRWIGF
jgi:hypothetical protein